MAAALVAALGTGSCRTRLPGYDDDLGPPRVDAFDAAAPLDLTVPRDNCGDYIIETTRVIRADMLLVQDKSRSMSYGINGERNAPLGQRKWDLVAAAIKQVVGSTSSVDWGLMLFGDSTQCGAPVVPEVAVGPATAGTIRQVLDATELDSGTPTTAALRNALAWYKKVNDKQPHFMVLATDGQPACSNGNNPPFNGDDSPASIAAVATAAAAGIPTFVVGIGSNNGAEQTLATMAVAGGVPNTAPGQPAYYKVTSTQDLVDVLEKAAIRITPCTYPLEHTPPAPDRVTIQGPSGIFPHDPQHVDGWDYSEDGMHVVFFGASCMQLKQGAVRAVQAIYGCPGDMSM